MADKNTAVHAVVSHNQRLNRDASKTVHRAYKSKSKSISFGDTKYKHEVGKSADVSAFGVLHD